MTPILTAPTELSLPARLYGGLSRRYDMTTRAAIPAQWDDYAAMTTRPNSPSPHAHFGIAYGASGTGAFDYLSGQLLSDDASPADGYARLRIAATTYARFVTAAPISTMPAAWSEVYGHWHAGPATGPCLEYYPPEFDGRTGLGGYELWVPTAP